MSPIGSPTGKPRLSQTFSGSDLQSMSTMRQKALDIVDGPYVKAAMGFVITLNALQVVYESDVGSACKWEDSQSDCDAESGWLYITNWVYLGLYTIEMSLRIYAIRLPILWSGWDMFDGSIIVVGVLGEVLGSVLPSTGILRLFRLARLFRALHFIKLPHELHIMIHGFVSALMAIGVGLILVFLMLTLWAVVAIAVLNDVNHDPEILQHYEALSCPWGPKAWSTITNCIFTFTQILIMGEGWGCYATPLIERNWWALIFFMLVFFTVVLGMTNLILAVIVDKALDAHVLDLEKKAKEKKANRDNALSQFIALCATMDLDGSGSLTMDEIMKGYDSTKEFRHTLDLMEVGPQDLELLFCMMDKDHSGDLSYEEFGQQLSELNNDNPQTALSVIKHQLLEQHVLLNEITQCIGKKETLLDENSQSVVNAVVDTLDMYTSEGQNTEQPAKCDELVIQTQPNTELDVEQLRRRIQERALECCGLLEQETLAAFVIALQANVDQKQATVPKPSDDILTTRSKDAAVEVEQKAPSEPKAISDPLLEELQKVEGRLTAEFARLIVQLQGDLAPKARNYQYLCLPAASSPETSRVVSGSAETSLNVQRC